MCSATKLVEKSGDFSQYLQLYDAKIQFSITSKDITTTAFGKKPTDLVVVAVVVVVVRVRLRECHVTALGGNLELFS